LNAPLADYFRGDSGRPQAAQSRAWARSALPRLDRSAKAIVTLAARGNHTEALVLLREAAEILKRAGYPASPEDEPLFTLCSVLDPDAGRALTPSEAAAHYAELEPILRQILEIGRVTPRQLARRRIAGWVFLATMLVAGTALSLRPRENLALHQHAQASSSGFNTNPLGAVDGFRHGQLGFHSQEEDGAWLVIDLGAPHSLRQVLAFGRADCCFDQSIPLRLQGSLDGQAYQTLAERTTPFSQFDPWRVELGGQQRARYLRFQIAKRGFLVLSEVEVYGH
jgi:hypothetical protein